jgi:hypothetical protein
MSCLQRTLPKASNAVAANPNLYSSLSSKRLENFSTDEAFEMLREDIALQRKMLKPSELKQFDEAWGINESGDLLKFYDHGIPFIRSCSDFCYDWNLLRRETNCDSSERNPSSAGPSHSGHQYCLFKEIRNIQQDCRKKVEQLKFASDEHIGLDLLHCFVLDLLGRYSAVAHIFESKSAIDFSSTQFITRRSKMLCWCAILCFNIFFVFYSMLKGYVKGESW